MDITVTTSIGISAIIPPRCRSPRYMEVLFHVPCHIAEYPQDRMQLAAQVTQLRCDTFETTDLYHVPTLGFLEPTAIAPEAIAASLAPAPRSHALPSDQIPGQAQQVLNTARVQIQSDADQYVLVATRIYRRIPEPCYFVCYTPSFHYTGLEIEVRSVPARPEQGGDGRAPLDRLYGHFFNACQRTEADALIAAMQSAHPESESLSVNAKAAIAIRIPEVFTFDSIRWHTQYERAQIAQEITELLTNLNDVRTHDARYMPLYPERAALVRQISAELHTLLAGFETPDPTHDAPTSCKP